MGAALMPTFGILLAILIGVISFVATWRRLDDPVEIEKMSHDSKQAMDVGFVRGFDGRKHLRPMSYHLRFALSLLSGLVSATLGALWARFIFH